MPELSRRDACLIGVQMTVVRYLAQASGPPACCAACKGLLIHLLCAPVVLFHVVCLYPMPYHVSVMSRSQALVVSKVRLNEQAQAMVQQIQTPLAYKWQTRDC